MANRQEFGSPQGFWPDAVLSGHAHLYQRFTRTFDGREIPYAVAGSGGFAATPPVGGLPKAPVTDGEYTLVKQPIVEFGYLTITVDYTHKTHTSPSPSTTALADITEV